MSTLIPTVRLARVGTAAPAEGAKRGGDPCGQISAEGPHISTLKSTFLTTLKLFTVESTLSVRLQ